MSGTFGFSTGDTAQSFRTPCYKPPKPERFPILRNMLPSGDESDRSANSVHLMCRLAARQRDAGADLPWATRAVGFALLAESRGWGLFQSLNLPAWVELVFGLVLLDLAIYLQHRIFHYVPVL